MSRFNLRSWFRSRRPASVPRRRKLGFECCEQRRLLSIDPVVGVGAASDPVLPNVTELIEFDFATGIVTINGTDERDEVTIENDIEGDGASFGNFEVGIAVVRVTHEDIISGDTTSETFNSMFVDKVVFHGNDQQDVFHNLTGVASEVYGGDGNDWLYGGSGVDTLKGGAGEDYIDGGDGADFLYGQLDNDTIDGGGGGDLIHGGDGADTIDGQKGKDTIYGDDGHDTLSGGKAADTMYGGNGDDEMFGGLGNDIMYGDDGDDVVKGEDGADDLFGGGDQDWLYGGYGVDELFGDAGDDVLQGEWNADTLTGGEDDDRLYGGGANDTLHGGNGLDSLWGGDGVDDLTGGLGADRYLIHENKDASGTIANKTADDVSVNFENGDEDSVGGDGFAAGVWGFDDVVEIDEALKQLVDRTGNNALLLTANGNELTLRRHGAVTDDDGDGFITWASNADNTGIIKIAEPAFQDWEGDGGDHRTSFDDEVHNTIIHEIGHNWDDENPEWGDWKDLSGWSNPWFGPWKHDDNAEFASDYAESHPREDFAETFAAYFAFENGETFWDDDTSAVDSASDIQEKIDFMDDFLGSLV